MNYQDAHNWFFRVLAQAEKDKCQNEFLRDLYKNNLFFLLVHGLGRADADREWLYDRCVEIQENPDGHLDLWSREHYKSTIITFAKTIQDILINPEITVGIFSHTRPIAKTFLRQIKREFESNEALKELFPDILYSNPKKDSPKWSEDDGIVVKRQTNPKESTVEAHGLVDGQPTSRHFSLMIYDDVVTRESVTTPDMIAKTTEAWELSRNLSSENGGRTRYIGTRYHFNDTWGEIMRRQVVTPRIHTATDDGTLEGNPVLLTRERLAEKRREMGPYTSACQLFQNPKADEAQGFMREWLKFWSPAGWELMNKYVICDPAGEKKKENDFSVFMVVGLARDMNYYVIDMVRDRMNLSERTKTLFYLHQKYKPLLCGYEKIGMQSDIEHIEYVQAQKNYRFPIIPLGGTIPKNDRIRKLIPDFEQGRLFLPFQCQKMDYQNEMHDLTQSFIEEEYIPFPVAVHDDMLDCLARIKDPNSEWTMSFPITMNEPVVLSVAEMDWQKITGQAEAGMAINLED